MKSLSPILCVLLSLASLAGAADFTVTNIHNGGPGSLHQAILDANAAPNAGGQDRIVFSIPGSGVRFIDVSNQELPEITDPVIIDGYTQPGARPNTLAIGNDAIIRIQIANTNPDSGPMPGLHISAGTSIVRGLSITGFKAGYSAAGIRLTPPGTGSIIEGNFIGLHPDRETPEKNFVGISLTSQGNMIGGTTPASRNVIAGENTSAQAYGIWVQAEPNTISGNYIGTDAAGTHAFSHWYGIVVEGSLTGGVVIGGTGSGAGNLISGTIVAVQVGNFAPFGNYSPASGVEITGNLIGVKSDGETPLGNNEKGIYILASSNTLVGGLAPGAGNVITFRNGGAGVFLDDFGTGPLPTNNTILSNSIFGVGRGIALGRDGPNSNDAMDADEGENHLQNFPIITSTSVAGDNMSIEGTLNSAPDTQFTIQLFADGGVLEPGQAFLGTTTATTDSTGNANFSATVPAPNGAASINATATDPAGNTSEFFRRPSRFRNLSTRARIQPGEEGLIGGFITQGDSLTGAMIIIRALGPSLSGSGLSDLLEDPILEVYDGSGQRIRSNDNWRDDPFSYQIEKHGLAPANDLESAVYILPGPGQYTAIIRGKDNSSGIGVLEFYDVFGRINLRPVNLSTRGLVQPGDNVMISGFILLDGAGPTRVIVRAIGPSLVSAGIANPLADPNLELHDGNGALLASNDNWNETQEAELNAIGLAPKDPAEAAIFALLSPGTYTAVVRGQGNSSGIALVEVYQLP